MKLSILIIIYAGECLTVDGYMSRLSTKDLLNFHHFCLNFRLFPDFFLTKFATFFRKNHFMIFRERISLEIFDRNFFLPFQYSNSIIVIFKWNPAEEFCSITKVPPKERRLRILLNSSRPTKAVPDRFPFEYSKHSETFFIRSREKTEKT